LFGIGNIWGAFYFYGLILLLIIETALLSLLAAFYVDWSVIRQSIKLAGGTHKAEDVAKEVEHEVYPVFRRFVRLRQHVWVFSSLVIPPLYVVIGSTWDWFWLEPIGIHIVYLFYYLTLSAMFLLEPHWRYRTLSALSAAIAQRTNGNRIALFLGWILIVATSLLLLAGSLFLGYSDLLMPGSSGRDGSVIFTWVANLPLLSALEWDQTTLIASSVAALPLLLLPLIIRTAYRLLEKIACQVGAQEKAHDDVLSERVAIRDNAGEAKISALQQLQ